MKYFLYCRKSTDDEDRQILSIEAQLAELQEFSQRERLEIIETFIEKKTAKMPGRPIFNEMMKRIEKGEAEGIIAWHPDRLARNSVDGGLIIFQLDTGKLKDLKFPTFWFDSTPQGKFMLNIAFGQSKYYIDNLSENVRRGIRQKLRRGEWPVRAPVGYINNPRTRKIDVDEEKARLVRKIFELYATGKYTMVDLQKFADLNGLVSRLGETRKKKLALASIQRILTNPIYYGLIKYAGETYPGIHKPIISKKLFEKVQEIMKRKGKANKQRKHNFAFLNLAKCGECGCAFTAQYAKGKCGGIYTYYRCTKKSKNHKCSQPYLQEKHFAEQIKTLFQKVSLSDKWAKAMLIKIDEWEKQKEQSKISFAQNLESELKIVDEKLEKLLDLNIEKIITLEEYQTKKQKFVSQKLEIQQRIADFERKGNNWLEPLRNFIKTANQAKNLASSENYSEMRDFCKKIGTNPKIENKVFSVVLKKPFQILAQAEPRLWRGEAKYSRSAENFAMSMFTISLEPILSEIFDAG